MELAYALDDTGQGCHHYREVDQDLLITPELFPANYRMANQLCSSITLNLLTCLSLKRNRERHLMNYLSLQSLHEW